MANDVSIIWDEETLEHIARHGIRKGDVENVFEGRVYIRRNGEEYSIIGRSLDKYILKQAFSRQI